MLLGYTAGRAGTGMHIAALRRAAAATSRQRKNCLSARLSLDAIVDALRRN